MITDIITSEWGIYLLTIVVGASIGSLFAVSNTPRPRPVANVALIALVLAVVLVAVACREVAPWIGPLFALAVGASSALMAGHLLRDHPLLVDEPYLRRVVLGVTQSQRLREVSDREEAASFHP